jgi:hypothetical protein
LPATLSFSSKVTPETKRSVQLQLSFNDNWETFQSIERVYLHPRLGVDYRRDAYLRLRNDRPRKAGAAFRA